MGTKHFSHCNWILFQFQFNKTKNTKANKEFEIDKSKIKGKAKMMVFILLLDLCVVYCQLDFYFILSFLCVHCWWNVIFFQRSLCSHICFTSSLSFPKQTNTKKRQSRSWKRVSTQNMQWELMRVLCTNFLFHFLLCSAQVNKLTQQNKLKIELNARHNWSPYILYEYKYRYDAYYVDLFGNCDKNHKTQMNSEKITGCWQTELKLQITCEKWFENISDSYSSHFGFLLWLPLCFRASAFTIENASCMRFCLETNPIKAHLCLLLSKKKRNRVKSTSQSYFGDHVWVTEGFLLRWGFERNKRKNFKRFNTEQITNTRVIFNSINPCA